MRYLTILILAVITTPVNAKLYKCVINGKTSYQAIPCKGVGGEFSLKKDISKAQQEPVVQKLKSDLETMSDTDGVEYRIIKDTHKRDIKRVVDVELNKKVSDDVLKKIALNIKKKDSKFYQRTFISYFIEGSDRNAGSWAWTNFNPNLKVKILGLSIEEEQDLRKRVNSKNDRNIVGLWLDDSPSDGHIVTLFYNNGKLFLERAYPFGNLGISEMTMRSINRGRRIDYKIPDESGNSYYIITSSNALELWDKDGLLYTARRLP